VHPAYRALTEELAELRAQTGDQVAEAPIEEGPAIKPGQSDPRIPAIRARLARLGHLTLATVEPSASEEADTPVFGSPDDVVAVQPVVVKSDISDVLDEPLVEAVKAFQGAAGLTADGVIGPKTVAAMNADTTEERISRLVYNIERLRWMPRDFGSKHVFVNQASFTARVVENGQTVWQTKVIVGKPNTQTASFSDEMETVVINPYWGVPASIIVKEMVRDMRGDPSWFEREGYEVLDASGRVISPYSVNWYGLSMNNIKIGVRQPPGRNNALGEIKFLFPNKHSIYMHDTPSKPLFSKPMRAFSHGCVRVENPRKFAEYILGWDAERIAAEIEMGGDNESVPLEQKIPVHLAYFTAWPDESGKVQYFEDVYGRDDLLERAFGTLVLAMQ
jgi:murein L,D-transpeptidase YcbB/YkuD